MIYFGYENPADAAGEGRNVIHSDPAGRAVFTPPELSYQSLKPKNFKDDRDLQRKTYDFFLSFQAKKYWFLQEKASAIPSIKRYVEKNCEKSVETEKFQLYFCDPEK